jgi:polyferredoxin/tetratricopeptide (TPR) repeat protein
MPIPGPKPENAAPSPPAHGGNGLSLPVLKVDGSPRKLAKSRMGRWRAAVLIAVHLAIIGHVAFWFFTGMRETVSPVEPSEAMYTLETGLVNAGFVFFLLALISTAIMGRFFCGWGCHVIALQDLCSWIMNKCGVRPKPFRSRLLIWAPLILALYMFVWPTFKREVLRPAAEYAGLWERWMAFFDPVPPPVFHSGGKGLEFFQQHFTKAEFWETFPAWYIAIPFLLVCGFAIVYFLGSKAFCTYGCPYGGFFAPLDKLAPGRIRVTDACQHCGHCTAACTSNVRVHEEVRDYGMVVDPGCMKCMDCISVCPNDALYFGMGKPSAFAKRRNLTAETPRTPRRLRFPDFRFWNGRPRTASAKHGSPKANIQSPKSRRYDLSRGEELVIGAIFLGMILGYRGMLNQVPLLMAMGLAAIGAFLSWKLWRLIRDPNVRIQSLQLKYKGQFRLPAAVFAFAALLMMAAAAWSGTVRYSHWRAAVLDNQIQASFDEVFSPGYIPDPAHRDKAGAALAHFRRGNSPAEGGIGWPRRPAQEIETQRRMAWLAAVAGDMEASEGHMVRGILTANADPSTSIADLVDGLGRMYAIRRESLQAMTARLERLVDQAPRLHEIHLVLAEIAAATGEHVKAVAFAEAAANSLERLIAEKPKQLHLRETRTRALLMAGKLPEAIAELLAAAELDPRNAALAGGIAQLLAAAGRHEEAAQWTARASELSQAALQDVRPAQPQSPHR